jgi:hypothetical protein
MQWILPAAVEMLHWYGRKFWFSLILIGWHILHLISTLLNDLINPGSGPSANMTSLERLVPWDTCWAWNVTV